MDGDGSQPTQATQRALDPRRVGQQNSGFSDEDISDIVCLLYPYSPSARREVSLIARSDLKHVVGTEDAAVIEPDYELEDNAARFQVPQHMGDYAIILRLSALVKNQLQGFQFGRNTAKCDICFTNDPKKRLSNVHFRIYINSYGVVMLEDQSTNGTFVDNQLLRAKNPNPNNNLDVRRQLTHGSKVKVLMHEETEDLVFLVRIPRREGEYDRNYTANVAEYFERVRDMGGDVDETIITGAGGHPDLFSTPKQKGPARHGRVPLPASTTQDNMGRFQTEWRGSEKYSKVNQIGKGAFAVVHKVTRRFDGKPYAAKELEKRRFVKNGVLDQKVDNEMKIMQKVDHPNIVRYIDHFDWENRLLIIIMEFVPGGDLGRLISERGALPELVAKHMASQMLSALGYLHENNITHRDVKPDNILIHSMNPFTVKLTDFGLSKMVDTEQTFLRTFCGTLLYCAPEVYTEYLEYDDQGFRQPRRTRRPPPGQRYDHAVDIWSLGGVLFYALTSKPPYPVKNGISYSELLHQIMTTDLNTLPLVERDTSADAIGFLRSMLNRRPEQRARVEDLENHPWMGGPRPGDDRSVDEIIEGVNVSASQMSIQDSKSGQSIPSQQFEDGLDLDHIVDDFVMEDSPVDSDENSYEGTFGKQGGPPRLFGEVNVSAVGSSGVIPEDRLNISLPGARHGTEDSMETEIRDSNGDSGRASTGGGQSSGGVDLFASVANGQSSDQLQSLVINVQSQSLGASQSVVQNENAKPLAVPSFDGSYFTASKRKPVDTSDEFDSQERQKPIVKRLRSEGNIEALGDHAAEELGLLASMAFVKRLESGRQFDGPQDKRVFWENQDIGSWHLHYPEMTELQLQVFQQAAHARKEKFTPGKTPLWDLAMKFFPPTNDSPVLSDTEHPLAGPSSPDTTRGGLLRDHRSITSLTDIPSTAIDAPPSEGDSLPDTLPPDTQNIVVPRFNEDRGNQVFALLESTTDSVLPGISLPITDTLLSWGRGPDNTAVHPNRTETRVPKYAVRILLWKEGYDPSRKPSHKAAKPWERDGNAGSYHFYLSTKATMGVHVNGVLLPPTRPGTTPNWVRLQHGDELVIWGAMATPDKAKLTFQCFWGGSSTARGAGAPSLVPAPAAQKLEEACSRTEQKHKAEVERAARMAAAGADMRKRKMRIESERERTRFFELEIRDAREFLARAGTRSPAASGGGS